VFPQSQPHGTSALPTSAAFWMPRPDEISEEGFSYFRDTWLIKDVSVGEARDVMTEERRIAEVVGQLANDPEDFERLAQIAESSRLDDPAHEMSDRERAALSEVVSDLPELGGLELGVAGLAYALATVRILPAASCRSHVEHSWSDAPVVLFAVTEFRAKALQPLVDASGCTFTIDEARPELLVVRATSISNTMALADAVIENRKAFVQHRSHVQRRSRPKPESTQESLFDW
jgi:hypothetical protein